MPGTGAIGRRIASAFDESVYLGMKRLGAGFLGLIVTFCFLLGIGEAALGSRTGIQYFAAGIVAALLMLLAWKKPETGGGVLLLLALLSSTYFFLTLTQFADRLRAAGIMSAPLYGAGILFLIAAKYPGSRVSDSNE